MGRIDTQLHRAGLRGAKQTLVMLFALIILFHPNEGLTQTGDVQAEEGAEEGGLDEAPDIEIELSQGAIQVGGVMTLALSVTLSEEAFLDDVQLEDTGYLEILDRRLVESRTETGEKRVQVYLDLTAYRPGNHSVGSIELSIADLEGEILVYSLPGFTTEVVSVLANETAPVIRAEKSGIAVFFRDYTMAWILGIGIGLICMGIIGYAVAMSRPRVVELPPEKPPRPAHEVAFEKLDKIRDDRLIELGEFMVFYIRLSGALREYLGSRYAFDGLESTTEEIRVHLAQITFPETIDKRLLLDLLNDFDLVKFAKQTLDTAVQEEALNQSYEVVRQTMIVPQVSPVAAPIEAEAVQ